MAVLSAETEFEPEFGGAMAWVSFAVGAVIAMVMVLLAYCILALPLWMIVLIYPVIGTVVALTVLMILYLRSEDSDGDQ
ncbi:MAG: hypothetical protein HRU33_24740 [Rhodobacteraceae bacterium]|nr:hypothetical protein [Paracoccaceae bacterium]